MMDGIIIERVPVNRFFRRRVGFWFGNWVWVSIAEKHGVSMDDVSKVDPIELTKDAFYFAAEWYSFKNRKRNVSRKSIGHAVDSMKYTQLQRIHDCMKKSRQGGESIMKTEESKKKQQLKS